MTEAEAQELISVYNSDYKNKWNQFILLAKCLGSNNIDYYKDDEENIVESSENIEIVKDELLKMLETI